MNVFSDPPAIIEEEPISPCNPPPIQESKIDLASETAIEGEGRDIDDNVDQAEIDLQQAESYLNCGLVLDAEEIFERYADSHYAAQARMGLAMCSFQREEIHSALSHLQGVALIDPEYPNLSNNMGVMLYGLGMIKEAREQFETAIQINPEDPLGWRNIADLCLETMDYEGCVEACERALELDPENYEINSMLEELTEQMDHKSISSPPNEPSKPEQLVAQVIDNLNEAQDPQANDVEPAIEQPAKEKIIEEPSPRQLAGADIRIGKIEQVQVVPLTYHVDDRGYLVEILRASDDHFTRFGQVYLVGDIKAGTIRAFHKHAQLTDWFFISHGSAKLIFVDDRPKSSTYGNMQTIVTGERNPCLITVPPGVYHGWMALADDTQMISTASEVYNRENPDEIRIPPDSFGDLWTVKGR